MRVDFFRCLLVGVFMRVAGHWNSESQGLATSSFAAKLTAWVEQPIMKRTSTAYNLCSLKVNESFCMVGNPHKWFDSVRACFKAVFVKWLPMWYPGLGWYIKALCVDQTQKDNSPHETGLFYIHPMLSPSYWINCGESSVKMLGNSIFNLWEACRRNFSNKLYR